MSFLKHTHARIAVAAGLIAASLALAGCGATGARPSASSSSGANAADAMFAQMMIPHHEQAVEMSDVVLSKPGVDARVTALAQQIKAAQAPEIATLRGWLAAWGQPTAMPSSHAMEGMMSGDEFAQLRAADGFTASKLFLTQMIAHHEGAVQMAQTERSSGLHPGALGVAGSIVDSQTEEIDTMKSLLGQL
jgi:uncharacterized protein (DUF305 family)